MSRTISREEDWVARFDAGGEHVSVSSVPV